MRHVWQALALALLAAGLCVVLVGLAVAWLGAELAPESAWSPP
jgi:hypothetical protein